MNYKSSAIVAIVSILFFAGCSSVSTDTRRSQQLVKSIQFSDSSGIREYDSTAIANEVNLGKDRVLYYLNSGAASFYFNDYTKSIKQLELAEQAIEELYTESISKGATSFLLNDNALDYSGEPYEDLYINVLKAISFLNTGSFDGAYVEVRRATTKLKELSLRTEQLIQAHNNSEDGSLYSLSNSGIYSSALTHYLSHLIYRAEGEYDNSRISLEKARETFALYPSVYPFQMPQALDSTTSTQNSHLNIIAFTGLGPIKRGVGARITSFDDFVLISDPTSYYVDAFYFPGISAGYNFKFEFPELIPTPSEISSIEVYADSIFLGRLELLEDMNKVAMQSFEVKKRMIFFKTLIRAITKGIGAKKIGNELEEKTAPGVGCLLAGLTNVLADISEQADLRAWSTMPGYALVGEYSILPGKYTIELRVNDRNNQVINRFYYDNYTINPTFNFINLLLPW